MDVAGMLEELNREIARLTQIRDLLGRNGHIGEAWSRSPEGFWQEARQRSFERARAQAEDAEC